MAPRKGAGRQAGSKASRHEVAPPTATHCEDGHIFHVGYTEEHALAKNKALELARTWAIVQHGLEPAKAPTTLAQDEAHAHDFKERWNAQRKQKTDRWRDRKTSRDSKDGDSDGVEGVVGGDTIVMENPLMAPEFRPTALDRVRSALSPRSRAGAYSPVPIQGTEQASSFDASSFDALQTQLEMGTGNRLDDRDTDGSDNAADDSWCGFRTVIDLPASIHEQHEASVDAGCERFFEHDDFAADIFQWARALEDTHIILPEATLGWLFSKIESGQFLTGPRGQPDRRKRKVLTRIEFGEYLAGTKPLSVVGKALAVLKLLVFTVSFWMVIGVVIGSSIGVARVTLWPNADQACVNGDAVGDAVNTSVTPSKNGTDVNFTVDASNCSTDFLMAQIACFFNVIGAIGIAVLSVRFSAPIVDGIEVGRLEVISQMHRHAEEYAERKGTSLPENETKRSEMAAALLFDTFKPDVQESYDSVDADFNVLAWRATLNAHHIIISQAAMMFLYVEAVGHAGYTNKKQLREYIGSLRPSTRRDRYFAVMRMTCTSGAFWCRLLYVAGCLGLLGNSCIWSETVTEDTKLLVHGISLVLNTLGCLGMLDLVSKSCQHALDQVREAQNSVYKHAIHKYEDVHGPTEKLDITTRIKQLEQGAWFLVTGMQPDDHDDEAHEMNSAGLRDGLGQNELLLPDLQMSNLFHHAKATGKSLFHLQSTDFERFIAGLMPVITSVRAEESARHGLRFRTVVFWLVLCYPVAFGIQIWCTVSTIEPTPSTDDLLDPTFVAPIFVPPDTTALRLLSSLLLLAGSFGALRLAYDATCMVVEDTEFAVMKLKMATMRHGHIRKKERRTERHMHMQCHVLEAQSSEDFE